ncbi:MAG: hypothetical protein J6A23_09085, partial [Thermoguttaceae bacterium]|nr:hypothetical protein [Thermoguttaceae bacterium]
FSAAPFAEVPDTARLWKETGGFGVSEEGDSHGMRLPAEWLSGDLREAAADPLFSRAIRFSKGLPFVNFGAAVRTRRTSVTTERTRFSMS